MAHVLRITDGTTTVNLADGVQVLNEYSPKPGVDGMEVKESVRLTITAASSSAALTTLQSINKLLDQAKRFNEYEVGARVYVEFDPGTSGTVRRSLLTGGTIATNSDTLDSQWANYQIEIVINWTRMGGWEWPEVEIPLSNTSGSGTGGRAITNHNNGAYENWVKILAADITGDMPARVRLQLTHTYVVNPFMNTIHVHHKVDNVNTFYPVIEGETGTGGTDIASADFSNNYKKRVSWSTVTKDKILSWTLSSALLDALDHGKVQILMAIVPTAYTDLYMQFQIRNQTTYTLIAESALTPVPDNQCLFVLDTTRLPPAQSGGSNAPLVFELYAQRLTAGTHTLDIDFIQFSPVADESWRRYSHVDATGGLKYAEILIDDGINDYVYRDASGLRVSDFSAIGGPLLLKPGRDQKLYFLASEVGGSWRKLQTFTVRAYYRPRTTVL